jgi:hypothetical protein
MTTQHRPATPTPAQFVTLNAMHRAAAERGALAVCCGALPCGTYVYRVARPERPAHHMVVRVAADGTWESERHAAPLTPSGGAQTMATTKKAKTVVTPKIDLLHVLRRIDNWSAEELDKHYPGFGAAMRTAYIDTRAGGRVYDAGGGEVISDVELCAMLNAASPGVGPREKITIRPRRVQEPPPGRPTDPVPPAIVPPPAPDPHPTDVLAERLLFARDRASVDQLEGGTGLNPHELLGHFGSLGFPPWWAARFTAALLLEARRDPSTP